MQQQTEKVFDENGQTVEEPAEVVETVAAPAEPEVDTEQPTETPQETQVTGKYRIGDKVFATQAEALAYAESQVQTHSEIDAYRQVLREAISNTRAPQPQQEVLQTDELGADELYTDPSKFLKKFETKIKTETLAQVQQQQALQDQDNRVWREFTDRHPELADFRKEITGVAQEYAPEVSAIAQTKGQAAAYDYVATKFKVQVQRLNSVLKPKRELRNSQGSTPVGVQAQTVTPKEPPKKALSFAEEIRQMRRRRHT